MAQCYCINVVLWRKIRSMGTESESIRKVICPICGKVFPVRFYVNGKTLRYSVYCNECKKTSEVDVTDITQ